MPYKIVNPVICTMYPLPIVPASPPSSSCPCRSPQQRLVSILGVRLLTPCTPSLSSRLPIFLHLNVSSYMVARYVQGSSSLHYFERRDERINIAGWAAEKGESGISTLVSRRQQEKNNTKQMKSRKSLKVEAYSGKCKRKQRPRRRETDRRLRVPVHGQ